MFIIEKKNCLINLASPMVLPNLFHSLIQKGEKECLKLSVLQENSGELLLFVFVFLVI